MKFDLEMKSIEFITSSQIEVAFSVPGRIQRIRVLMETDKTFRRKVEAELKSARITERVCRGQIPERNSRISARR
jgi:hypothetical protein